jgi:hypothetical protein
LAGFFYTQNLQLLKEGKSYLTGTDGIVDVVADVVDGDDHRASCAGGLMNN